MSHLLFIKDTLLLYKCEVNLPAHAHYICIVRGNHRTSCHDSLCIAVEACLISATDYKTSSTEEMQYEPCDPFQFTTARVKLFFLKCVSEAINQKYDAMRAFLQ